jgi:aryl carrier-like protein
MPGAAPLDYLRREIALLTGAVEADVDVDRAPIALGLDSLKLIELSTRVRRDLLVEAPLRRYARAPSVRALAEDLLLLLSTRPALAASDDAELFLI